jgi:hypothetical protein
MRTIDTIREFKTKNFTVRMTAEEDNDIDLSWDEDGSVLAGLESGKFIAFCAACKVYFRGNEVASDYLGQCIYESPRAFMDHIGIRRYSPNPGKIPAGQCGSYFSDMVRSAIAEARKAISDMQSVRVRA